MSEIRLLRYGQSDEQFESLIHSWGQTCEIVQTLTLNEFLEALRTDQFAGLLFSGSSELATGLLLDSGGVIEHIPVGVVLLNENQETLWFNQKFQEMTAVDQLGHLFFEAFGKVEILGPDFNPFTTALGFGQSAKSTLRVGEKNYFEIRVEPVFPKALETREEENTTTEDLREESNTGFLVVIVLDITQEILHKEKLKAIHQAGQELGDISPEELIEMTVDERIGLLNSKILESTRNLLEFDTVEIRLLDRKENKLDLLIAHGMQDEARERVLFAKTSGNGVTGFVAATGNSYLCEETQNDPLYLPGAIGARSSLTVPIMLHDEVIGTFNVESPQPNSFDSNDLQFLELFSREVAVAINTLELLVVEKMTAATEQSEKILKTIATPVDKILNDATRILERYIGHEPEVCERLQQILKHTREIKTKIQRIGDDYSSQPTRSQLQNKPHNLILRGKRILVVDSDETVRQAAHEILNRYQCEVETAHDAEEAFLMVRSYHYDAVIIDIRLPDKNGYECFSGLREIHDHLPVILMTGFGYDPAHSIVKARQEGCTAVLYKPFRIEQLIGELETAITTPGKYVESPR